MGLRQGPFGVDEKISPSCNTKRPGDRLRPATDRHEWGTPNDVPGGCCGDPLPQIATQPPFGAFAVVCGA
jgi:hypothetical protein